MKLVAKVAAVLLIGGLLLSACSGISATLGMGGLSRDTQASAQTATAPVSAIDQAIQAASDALIDAGNPGTTGLRSGGPAPSPSVITFPSQIQLTVDLSQSDEGGHRRYPGSTGLMDLRATGTVTACSGDGSVPFEVQVTAATDLHFTDPQSGASATIAAGTVFAYPLGLHWTFTDADTWTLTSELVYWVDHLTFLVHHRSRVISRILASQRHISEGYSKVAGVATREQEVTGNSTVILADSTGTHTIRIHRPALDVITLTVDGVAYGPYTRAQIQALFHLRCV